MYFYTVWTINTYAKKNFIMCDKNLVSQHRIEMQAAYH